MIAATTSEAIASPCWKPSATAVMPKRTATEPAMSPAKWKALERSAADLYFLALRRRDGDAAEVDDEGDADHREDVPARVEAGVAAAAEAVDRLDHDEGATAGEDRRLAERREVLGAPVPVGVLAVGRLAAEADREQREDRRDDVAARLDPGRDQGQRAGRDPGAELEHDEEDGGADRDQGGLGLAAGGAGFAHRVSLWGGAARSSHETVARRIRTTRSGSYLIWAWVKRRCVSAGGGVVLVAFAVLGLLGGGAVVGEAVGLDHEVEVGEVEVDFVAGDVDRGARERQARLAGERDEDALELGAGVAEGAPVEDLPQPRDPRLAGVIVERLAQIVGADEPQPVRLVDRPLHRRPAVPRREVDQRLHRRRHRDPFVEPVPAGPEGRTTMNAGCRERGSDRRDGRLTSIADRLRPMANSGGAVVAETTGGAALE